MCVGALAYGGCVGVAHVAVGLEVLRGDGISLGPLHILRYGLPIGVRGDALSGDEKKGRGGGFGQRGKRIRSKI